MTIEELRLRFDDLADWATVHYGVKIKTKKTLLWLWLIMDFMMRVLTFGQVKHFIYSYTITLGRTIYFPIQWDREILVERDYLVLKQEVSHVIQMKKLGLGNVYLGSAVWLFAFFFLPCPILFAWFRYKWKREAYLESWRLGQKVGINIPVEHYAHALTSSLFVWTWFSRKQVLRWFQENCQ